MGFLETLAIFVVSSLIAILLRPKIENTGEPGDFRPPEPREGEPITVIWGTVKVSPAVTWFGDVGFEEVVKTESALFGLISEDIPLGYNYFAGMQLIICHGPIDALLDIHIGEYNLVRRARPRPADHAGRVAIPRVEVRNVNPELPIEYTDGVPTEVYMNMPDLFGGAEELGGIVGKMDLHWGTETQGQNPYLALWWGSDILPQYRGITYAVLNRMNMGKNPQPQPWQFVCLRIPQVLGDNTLSEITDADGNATANGAECIYELLTNTRWGVGMASDDIDLASFQAVAQTLFDEGLGYNGQLTSRQTAWNAIKQILRHMNGTLYQDPTTGKLGLKVIREDYVLANLPEFNESNAVLEEFKRGSWAEVINETSVNYTDIARRFSSAAAQAQNLASIQAMDEIVTSELDLPGLSTHELAQDAASRSNRATSVPVTRGRLTTTRSGYDLHQGSAFKISFPHFGVSEIPCRVTSINYGSLLEGRMEIEFVEDPFNHINPYASPSDLVDNIFCGPLSLLVETYDDSADPAARLGPGVTDVFEAPYWHAGAVEKAWALASRRNNQDLHWIAEITEGNTAYERSSYQRSFSPVGRLRSDLAKTGAQTGVSLTLDNLGELETLTSTTPTGRTDGDRLAIISNGTDDEIIAWETVIDNGDGTFTITNVMRGVLDTVPTNHPEGSTVKFYWSSSGGQNAYDLYAEGYGVGRDGVGVRALRVDIEGLEQSPQRSTPDFAVMTQRASAPYPPGRVTLDSNEYTAWPATTNGDVTLGWTQRSRTGQTDIVAQDDATGYTLEGTIKVEVMIGGQVVRTFSGLTGTSQVYTYAQRTADDADLTKKVQFRITPSNGGIEGIARITPPFLMNS